MVEDEGERECLEWRGRWYELEVHKSYWEERKNLSAGERWGECQWQQKVACRSRPSVMVPEPSTYTLLSVWPWDQLAKPLLHLIYTAVYLNQILWRDPSSDCRGTLSTGQASGGRYSFMLPNTHLYMQSNGSQPLEPHKNYLDNLKKPLLARPHPNTIASEPLLQDRTILKFNQSWERLTSEDPSRAQMLKSL